MPSEIWEILDRAVQWGVIPLCALLWWMHQRQATQDGHIERILTIIDERERRRTEDRETHSGEMKSVADAIRDLKTEIHQLRITG
jgi:hypothetical protein